MLDIPAGTDKISRVPIIRVRSDDVSTQGQTSVRIRCLLRESLEVLTGLLLLQSSTEINCDENEGGTREDGP
jgi:hypothetical protein